MLQQKRSFVMRFKHLSRFNSPCWNKSIISGVQGRVAQLTPSSSTALFEPLKTEHLSVRSWLAAITLGVLLLGLGSKLLSSKGKEPATENPVSYTGSGLLNSHQIVSLVEATITQNCTSKALSQQITETLEREDHSGAFERVEDSKDLAGLLTTHLRSVSRDNRFQVLYSSRPPDLSQARGRAFFRISEHLSVGLPSE